MNIFNLPDLGEGLLDAEIHEWFVKEGDTVKTDQLLVAMETAKAVVEVPCPQSGIIEKLFGKPGDIIKTGEPLIAFVGQCESADMGTVVGNLEESNEVTEDNFSLNDKKTRVKATPAVKVLAKKLGIDLTAVKGTGDHGVITSQDVQNFSQQSTQIPQGFEPLRGVRRAMSTSMSLSHAEVVPVSIFDEVDIHQWRPGTDITVRLIKAIIQAVQLEPSLNAWYDSKYNARKCFEQVNLGLAIDNEEGLFVPVIHDAANLSDSALRDTINALKKDVSQRSLPTEKLTGATITLSNFGKFAGRFASPIIVPPMVAILAVGKLHQGVVAGKSNMSEIHNILPLSLSFDHRVVTGGEATRFLGAMINALELAD